MTSGGIDEATGKMTDFVWTKNAEVLPVDFWLANKKRSIEDLDEI